MRAWYSRVARSGASEQVRPTGWEASTPGTFGARNTPHFSRKWDVNNKYFVNYCKLCCTHAKNGWCSDNF